MTDTGQVPAEGLPESAGMVEQPGVPAHGAYTYLSETTAEDEDLLLLPGAQSAWGNEVAPPAPAPVVEAVHEPGPHETGGRDSGSVDLSAVRLATQTATAQATAPIPPRRPLHLGPPTPDASASPVRSLADRGPAGMPAPGRQFGTPAPTSSPEYLDAPPLLADTAPQGASPWGTQADTQAHTAVQAPPAPLLGTEAHPAETVAPLLAESPAPVVPAPEPPEAAPAAQETAPEAAYGVPETAPEPPEPVHPAHTPEGAYADQGPEAYEPAVPPAEAAYAFEVPPLPDPATPHPAAEAPEPDAVFPAPPAAPEVFQAPQEPEGAVPQPEAQEAHDAQDAELIVVPQAEPVSGVPDTQVVPDAQLVPEVQFVPEGEPQEPQAVDPGVPVEAQGVPVEQFATPPAVVEEPQAVVHPVDPAFQQADGVAQVAEVAVPEELQQEAVPAEAPEPVLEHAEHLLVEPQPFVTEVAEAQAAAAVPEEEVAVLTAPEEVAVASDQLPTPTEPTPPAPEPLPALALPEEPAEQPPSAVEQVGQFVAVDGTVPTAPHLAPTPPHALVLPQENEPAPVPAPEPEPPTLDLDAVEAEAEIEFVQQAADLDTRAADQEQPEELEHQAEPEEGAAVVEEARESTGPAAPAYDDAEREAVLKVMRERRDIRNGFRSDPIPHDVLLRILEAAHTAPSVGHSQPWDFVVIRSAETRATMHELAARQREAYAKSLPKGRAKQFKELKIEAILDTPVNIVVTADPTRGGRHTLGRHTQPQMAPYSSALAVENLWLAARAEGIGVGWVSFFDEREMVRALGLPEHLEVVAYLCVGYVDEFPEEPELAQAGWSKRRPLSWVVHEETYGRRALPGEEPHDLLSETVANIRPLDAKALGEAWERQKRMTKPAGALGMLEIISAQLSGLSRMCPPPIPEPAAVAIFAGDHGVHAQGVTPWPQEVTAQMVANFLGGGAVCNAFANQVGAEVCVIDVGVASDLPATPGLLPRKIRAGTSDMTTGPAMTREEAKAAIEVGIETARDLVAAGNKALLTGEMGIANTTASAALISVFTDTDPAEVTGRGTGINDETLARKTEVVRRAIDFHQPDPADPIGVLAAIGGFEHAAMVGLLLGGASLRTPVILDGVSAGAAALVARAIAPEVLAACIAGHRSAEPGHVAALNKLGLRPLVDLDLRLGEGTGALLALPLVQSTARAMHEVATFDSAGVTEK
ncbi:nicotinate-nucleotide--dimethylbenzimidazole phosphoribosyltransferase [Streptomyces geranii]|uniref:nicotinate-nucleotide--dimethylbenzimidazole phosphoribosyltransferase n=1 Tax=Streptomyces geranii TaxID=2058923 RepID=UPI000D030D6C|nr:nicotinate-nucleotide--dimethylbenzimidazole phosphoribosyltransferase [Streptomyces geranii]